MPDVWGVALWRGLMAYDSPLVDRVVFVTGDTVDPETNRFLEDTGRPVITKPFGLETLAVKLTPWLPAPPGPPPPLPPPPPPPPPPRRRPPARAAGPRVGRLLRPPRDDALRQFADDDRSRRVPRLVDPHFERCPDPGIEIGRAHV